MTNLQETINISILPLPNGVTAQQYLSLRAMVNNAFTTAVADNRVLQADDFVERSGGNPAFHERSLTRATTEIMDTLSPSNEADRARIQQATGLTAQQLQRVGELISAEASLNGGDIANGRANRQVTVDTLNAVSAASVVGSVALNAASPAGTALAGGVAVPAINQVSSNTAPTVRRP